ncbi:DapH/DapD/GlmU-related protein [Exiguobacterium sp. s146]|uniref:serine O-acetyltransferase n=1 Tax=Exiguobacterium sp. s146 TaxID=2751223 RepID=UPI001BE78B30|nr:DapH/DapD/GlmU-related protein [Exiguobacterium sp. s146]
MNAIMKSYLFARKLHMRRIPVIPNLITICNRILFSCDIPPTSEIHPTTKLGHNGLGLVIHPNSAIGENSVIMQQVTIGGNHGKMRVQDGREFGHPIIGKNVFVGAGAKIVGPIFIGDNVIIGANSVVTKDCISNGVYAGIPAKRLKDIPDQDPNNNLHYGNF